MEAEVYVIWGDLASAPTNQEGLAVLFQYLLNGMDSRRRDFYGHAQLLHVGGGGYSTLFTGTVSLTQGGTVPVRRVGFPFGRASKAHRAWGAPFMLLTRT